MSARMTTPQIGLKDLPRALPDGPRRLVGEARQSGTEGNEVTGQDGGQIGIGHSRRPMAVAVHSLAEPPEEARRRARRREREIECLIVKAVLSRATRLTGRAGAGCAVDRPLTLLDG